MSRNQPTRFSREDAHVYLWEQSVRWHARRARITSKASDACTLVRVAWQSVKPVGKV